ncbi:uncharacterized protein LOC143864141 isoform X2 [Tasmannia lanceolata]|uniref:uncharacterized protein LOC143864141 isoform X2 n=1 Tax=Tasmannia lanceolata TaxID=3420 RepID=UPI00406395FE
MENMELVKSEGCFPSLETAPWLVFPSEESQLFVSISKGKCDERNIRPWNKVWVSSHGWLVTEDEQRSLLLLQPISMEMIKIPRPEFNMQDSRYKCFLPLPPTDPNWVIFFMHQDCHLILLFRQGDTKWEVYRSRAAIIQHVVSLKGKFYAHTLRDRLAVVEVFPYLQVKVLEVEPMIKELTYGSFICKYLLESRGELFLVFKHNYHYTETFHSFFVFKMDFCKMKWVKVESIGADCIFFLGIGSGCVYYTANTRLKGDVIYFFNSEDNAFYAFDLEDGSLSINLCDQVGDNVWDTQFWLLPPISSGYVPSSNSELESTKEGNAKSKEIKQRPSTTITITRSEFDKMDVEERNWLELPDNIIELTRSRLFLSRDHIHFSFVFKSWRLIKPLVHLPRRPLLLFTHKGDGEDMNCKKGNSWRQHTLLKISNFSVHFLT